MGLVATIMSQDIVYAQGLSSSAYSAVQASETSERIPYSSGTIVEEKLYGDNGDLIINIQDAHASLGAQRSIVDILGHLVANYNVSLVAAEGSEGYIDTSILSAFPDKKIRELLKKRL